MNNTKILSELSAKGWVCVDTPSCLGHSDDMFTNYIRDTIGMHTFGFRSEILGDVASILSPKEGIVQSRKKLRGHTDASFLPFDTEWKKVRGLSIIPNYVALLSICGSDVGTTVCHIEEILYHMNDDEICELSSPNYVFEWQKSFVMESNELDSSWKPILHFSDGFFQVRFSNSIKTYKTEKAKKCAIKLSSLYQRLCQKIALKTDQLLIVNNRRCIHGREFISEESFSRKLHRYYLYEKEDLVVKTDIKGIVLP
ncbi:TauD/TfdA family dioxygenase [Photorhabdus australis]|uniref:TauD/TfdA family dioxygenase n=1 Tax=Photorhabdus australis TaxID=286156 RepID=UPI00056B1059|nr:TauD/TfdA family dioxygenase [Photorhabdus australis]